MGHVMIILTGPNVCSSQKQNGALVNSARKTAGYTGFRRHYGEETSKHHKLTPSKYIIKMNWDQRKKPDHNI